MIPTLFIFHGTNGCQPIDKGIDLIDLQKIKESIQPPRFGVNYSPANSDTKKEFLSMAQARMANFTPTHVFVDSVELTLLKDLDKLAVSYGFGVVRITFDHTIREAQEKNQNTKEPMEDSALKELFGKLKDFNRFSDWKTFNFYDLQHSRVMDNFEESPLDLTKHESVLFIGDIQGCNNSLLKVLEYAKLKNSYLIFTGDLTDRGPENFKVVETVMSLNAGKTLKVRGNHETYSGLYWSGTRQSLRDSPFSETQKEYDKLGVLDNKNLVQRLQNFYRTFHTIRVIKYGKKEILVSHGGVNSWIDKGFWKYEGTSFIRGSNGYHLSSECDMEFTQSLNGNLNRFAIRGHRNCKHLPVWHSAEQYEAGKTLQTACLEQKVEYHPSNIVKSDVPDEGLENGHLAVLELTKSGFETMRFV